MCRILPGRRRRKCQHREFVLAAAFELFGIRPFLLLDLLKALTYLIVSTVSMRSYMGWFDETENSSCAIGPRLSADAVMVHALDGNALAQSLKPNSTILMSSFSVLCILMVCVH